MRLFGGIGVGRGNGSGIVTMALMLSQLRANPAFTIDGNLVFVNSSNTNTFIAINNVLTNYDTVRVEFSAVSALANASGFITTQSTARTLTLDARL